MLADGLKYAHFYDYIHFSHLVRRVCLPLTTETRFQKPAPRMLRAYECFYQIFVQLGPARIFILILLVQHGLHCRRLRFQFTTASFFSA